MNILYGAPTHPTCRVEYGSKGSEDMVLVGNQLLTLYIIYGLFTKKTARLRLKNEIVEVLVGFVTLFFCPQLAFRVTC
jgi:hypothetical protein